MSVKVINIPVNSTGSFGQKNDLGLTVGYAYTDQNQNLNDSSLLNKHRSDVRTMAGGYITYAHSADSSDYTLTGYNSSVFAWDVMLIDGNTGNNVQRFVSNNGASVMVTMNSNVGVLFVRDADGYRISTVSYRYATDYGYAYNGYVPTITKTALSRDITLSRPGTKFWGFLIS